MVAWLLEAWSFALLSLVNEVAYLGGSSSLQTGFKQAKAIGTSQRWEIGWLGTKSHQRQQQEACTATAKSGKRAAPRSARKDRQATLLRPRPSTVSCCTVRNAITASCALV